MKFAGEEAGIFLLVLSCDKAFLLSYMCTGSVQGFPCCFSMLILRSPNGGELECRFFSILITAAVEVGLISLLLFFFSCSCGVEQSFLTL